jgi:hypothetical protein
MRLHRPGARSVTVSRPVGGIEVRGWPDLRFYIQDFSLSPQPVLIRALFAISPARSGPYSSVHGDGARRLEPKVILVEDEFSTMTDEDYNVALTAWLAEVDAADAVVVPVYRRRDVAGSPGGRRSVTEGCPKASATISRR